METLNFSECTLGLLEDTFGLNKKILSNLGSWINTSFELNNFQNESVQHLVRILTNNAEHWNEYDLGLHFIGPMFSLVDFTQPYRFNLFGQSTLTSVVDGIQLTGRVDEMIATGFRIPKAPFFAFSEYKRQTDPNGDPAGQALAAMLAGQSLNEDGKPIYGCYVIGGIWRFMALEGRHYALSHAFDGTQTEDAFQILRILFQLKQYCMERTEPPPAN